MLNAGLVSEVSVDTNQSDKLLRLLDTVVIKLEGGSEDDLKVLDEKPIEYRAEIIRETVSATTTAESKNTTATTTTTPAANKAGTPDGESEKDTQPNKDGDDGEKIEIDSNADDSGNRSDSDAGKPSKKRKRTTSDGSSSSSSSSSDSDDDDADDAEKKDESIETGKFYENQYIYMQCYSLNFSFVNYSPIRKRWCR